jgi:hypothetical protein
LLREIKENYRRRKFKIKQSKSMKMKKYWKKRKKEMKNEMKNNKKIEKINKELSDKNKFVDISSSRPFFPSSPLPVSLPDKNMFISNDSVLSTKDISTSFEPSDQETLTSIIKPTDNKITSSFPYPQPLPYDQSSLPLPPPFSSLPPSPFPVVSPHVSTLPPNLSFPTSNLYQQQQPSQFLAQPSCLQSLYQSATPHQSEHASDPPSFLFFPFSVSMFYNPHVPLPSGKK